MTTTIKTNNLFHDAKISENQTAANLLFFHGTPLSPNSNSSGNMFIDDILFDDLNIIETRLGKRFLQGTVANANCDCGR